MYVFYTNPYRLPYTVVATSAYASTRLFTSIPGETGATVALLIDDVIVPYFGKMLEDYRDVALVPFFGQRVHEIISLQTSKVVCNWVFPHQLTVRQSILIFYSFKLTCWIIHELIRRTLNWEKRLIQQFYSTNNSFLNNLVNGYVKLINKINS